MRKSDVWHIKEDLARRMQRICEEIVCHIKNSDDRYLRLEERVYGIEKEKKVLKHTKRIQRK